MCFANLFGLPLEFFRLFKEFIRRDQHSSDHSQRADQAACRNNCPYTYVHGSVPPYNLCKKKTGSRSVSYLHTLFSFPFIDFISGAVAFYMSSGDSYNKNRSGMSVGTVDFITVKNYILFVAIKYNSLLK